MSALRRSRGAAAGSTAAGSTAAGSTAAGSTAADSTRANSSGAVSRGRSGRVRRRVCVVVTARPSYARIKSVMEAVRDHPDLELQLVVGASALLERYGQVVDVIRADGFEPDAVVYMVVEGENLVTTAKSTGHGVVELATIFDNLRPDVVVSVADRYETLATVIAAAYQNIPVAHVQGGEVTGSIDEKVRHAVTKLADLHLVATPAARERVIRMGEDPAAVHVTGCPSVDLAARVVARSDAGSFDPFPRYGGVGDRFDPAAGYLVVAQHPVTTEYEDALAQVTETLEAIKALDLPTFWFWPNVDAGSDRISKAIRHFRETREIPRVYFFKNLGPEDFLRLLVGCRCLVGNSSVGIREGSYLGVPVVNVGSRQAGRERGANVTEVGYERDAIAAAVRTHQANGRYPSSDLYGDGRAGERIAQLLAAADLRVEKRISY